jgi:LPS export ABC transporter protein LptC
VAKGNVVVVNPQGNRLETEELFWDRKSSKVASERFVRLVREDDVLTGVGFESDPNLERYRIEREVRASVREGGALRDELRDADTTGTAR